MFAKGEVESSKEIEQWNETLLHDVLKLCTDAYELKVRLEHILERITLICKVANTEKPSMIMSNPFIGRSLAARLVYILQHLGITHILCLWGRMKSGNRILNTPISSSTETSQQQMMKTQILRASSAAFYITSTRKRYGKRSLMEVETEEANNESLSSVV